ncbi:heavy-metal-associated domain-containing protein [Sphingorhabdus sp. Alg239-R122]|uniref:heavy-metal-associated domain-containing protein n=1 Tax=Sphingorhabdus sp. Alg239-R122 TaxID=2305989 RepID=UPI0013DAA7B2|nr:heavy-metal-associated domain-containing protein [Sphingorhabdus sp. Alg239-R122]
MDSVTFKGFNIRKAGVAGLTAIALGCGAITFAQIEGDRGVAPVSSNGDFEVSGVEVNVAGKSAEDAREAGWREAQRKGWVKLWRQSKGRGGAPALSDSALDAIVSAIVVEEEQIGPRRYIAKLGVLFDRARAAQILGVRGNRARSAPMLVVPVMWSGGSAQVFESRTDWQKAWARFRTADSRIDYVRPTGGGSDSLLLNAGQVERRGRIWWRLILDQFGAADVIMPMARLEREWPGGPIVGKFTARYGPDNRFLEGFQLRVANSNGLDVMLNEAVKRFDDIYSAALSRGTLRPDSSLVIEDPDANEEEEEAVETGEETETAIESAPSTVESAPPAASATTVSIQIATPDAGAVTSAQGALRGVPGVTSVNIGSVAVGGTSVMRVSYSGTIDGLRTALQSQGWQVQQGGNVLRISR